MKLTNTEEIVYKKTYLNTYYPPTPPRSSYINKSPNPSPIIDLDDNEINELSEISPWDKTGINLTINTNQVPFFENLQNMSNFTPGRKMEKGNKIINNNNFFVGR